MCFTCGKEVTGYGYRISWDISDLGLGEEGDDRYFCCINCVEKWIRNLGLTGREEIIDIDGLAFNHMKRAQYAPYYSWYPSEI